MKEIKIKAVKISILIGIVFFMTWQLSCYSKGFGWSHPLVVIFIPLWTLILIWISYSLVKKYYIRRAKYLSEKTSGFNNEYLNGYWVRKLSKYSILTAYASILMCLFYLFDYLKCNSGLRNILLYGILASLSFIIHFYLQFLINNKE